MSPSSERVRDLFDIPDQIRKGDFVHKLTEGVDAPAETARTYVVTPGLADAFDRALRLVGSALRDGHSQAAYLHGSFGSGKSHFMALLSLLLRGNEEAWRVAELHALRDKHDFVGKRRLLELHFHMVGQESIEGAVFSEYLDFVRERHPEAPVPALFADEALFENARALLDEIGDDKFFAPMNESAAADAGWGEVSGAWDRERFESAVASPDPGVRADLFSTLVKSRFAGWAESSRGFVDLDTGLATMTRHAAGLGYDGIVLFLDELILWLAGRAADAAWLHAEAQKMVKLVEAGDMNREIPLVSFIARQRDLAEMVGEDYAGVENARLRDVLDWWEGRYDLIRLEDRNLPAIVEKRILAPKDDQARATLDQAFEQMRKDARSSWSTLLGHEDAGAFRKLYPFSPALVDALVALSNSLQRQRTAIKLLMEILVEHIDDLKLGEVVRVGDLFDLLASGEDSADGVMKARFEAARQLYRYQLLPMIQAENGTTTEERCQRLRPSHPTRIGCSNCPEKACRTDNRIAKTLIIAALVPEVDVLKDMTASRLVQLNHGSIKVPIPGTEASMVAKKLRDWAAAIGQLQVGSEADPAVRLRLEGVDVGPILAKARNVDSAGARQRVLRDLLFGALAVEKVLDKGKDHKVDWRNTWRHGQIQFGNIRTMSPELLRCPEQHDWRLVIDYPFDDDTFGPNDDVQVLERFMDESGGSWTLAWLPSFFSDTMNKLLGELVILEHILESNATARQYVADLSVENQTRALVDLENLRSMKKAKLQTVLEEAYGLQSAREGDLDSARSLDKHLWILKPGAQLSSQIPPNLSAAVDAYVAALLGARWPRHPQLGQKLTARRVEHLVALFGELVDADDRRLTAERAQVDEARGTLGELGLVRTTENAIHLVEDRILQDLDNRRRQKAVESPTVGQVRHWIDESGKMGLQPEALDLAVRCYARWAARTFVYYGKPFTPAAGKPMPDEVVLEKPDLPAQTEWVAALDMAGHAYGVALPGKALHADNLKRFETALVVELADKTGPASKLPGLLADWAALLGVDKDADRLVTARSADELCAALSGQSAVGQVQRLAGFEARTSARALGKSLATVKAVVETLGNKLVYGVFQQLDGRKGELDGAESVLERAQAALRQDEVNLGLAERIRNLAEEGQRILAGSVKPPPPGPEPKPPPPVGQLVLDRSVNARGRKNVLAEVEKLEAELGAAIKEAGEDVELSLTVRVVKKDDK